MSTIAPPKAERPFVLALDVGTSSVRTLLYDVQGRQIEGVEGRTKYQMTATPDGGVEIDADVLCGHIFKTIDEGLSEASHALPNLGDAIATVGYSNFWHAMLGVDQEGRAVTPLYNWSDTRSAKDAKALATQLGVDWIHQRTGVVPHASYYPAKIAWLRRADPAKAKKVVRWVSIGEYLYAKLFGQFVCCVGMAAGTGLFDPNANEWSRDMLAALEIPVEQLSPLSEERQALTGLAGEYAKRWPALKQAKWHPAIGDGATSNIGSGCFTRELIAINVGTSGAMRTCWPAERVQIPKGLWCYRANREYALIGGALSNAGDVFEWCQTRLNLEKDTLETRLGQAQPDAHGLTVLPFFSGERSTGWHDTARASILGINLSTQPTDILQASLEAVCYRFAAIYDRLKNELSPSARIIASGGGILHSRFWTQMMADVIGVPVVASGVAEASSRGAALLAMEAFSVIKEFEEIPTPLGNVFEPDRKKHEVYKQGRARQEAFYAQLISDRAAQDQEKE